jgi:hypothetical protein
MLLLCWLPATLSLCLSVTHGLSGTFLVLPRRVKVEVVAVSEMQQKSFVNNKISLYTMARFDLMTHTIEFQAEVIPLDHTARDVCIIPIDVFLLILLSCRRLHIFR